MKKVFLLPIIITALTVSSLFCQSITNIMVNPTGTKIAYLKDIDSLYIKGLDSKNSLTLVDIGLKLNGNQRFLSWTKDSENLIYEKDGNLWKFNLKNNKKSSLLDQSKKPLSLFRYQLINQIEVSTNDFIYFSAGQNQSDNKEFQLYKLNLVNNNLQKLTEDSTNVSNVSISKNGKYTAYANYSVSGGWKSMISIIDNTTGSLIAKSKLFNETFFFGLDWSDDHNKLLARNARGGHQIFQLDLKNNIFMPLQLHNKPNQYYLSFFNDECVYELEYEGRLKIYSITNILTGEKNRVLSDENISYKTTIQKNRNISLAYFTKENRVEPLQLSKITLKKKEVSKIEKAYSFIKNNPLENYKYSYHNYENGDGKLSSSFVYYPKNYDSTSLKKYPLIILPYGAYIDEYPNFSYFLYEKLFTYLEKNYIIAFINTRGYAIEKRKKNYGKLQLEDTELFIENAIKDFKIDSSKVVVMGHSHGAAMVYYYLTHSNMFAGGIAINGAADWIEQAKLKNMVGLPGEMGGTPEELPESYAKASPIENIHKLNSNLLIVTGELDTQIPANINGQSFFYKAKSQNKNVKHVHFINEGHMIESIENRKEFWKSIDKFLKEINL